MCSSSCNYVFFRLILATILSFCIYWHPKSRMGSQDIYGEKEEERIGPKKRELHELLYTKIGKSGTIGLVSVFYYPAVSIIDSIA